MENYLINMRLEQWQLHKLLHLMNSIKFMQKIGIENIEKHEKELMDYGLETLKKK